MRKSIAIFRFIPIKRRHWWLPILKNKFTTTFGLITTNETSSILICISDEIKGFKNDVESQNLLLLAKRCNKHFLPPTLCPWGCSELIYKTGHIDMNISLQRFFLPKHSLKLVNGKKHHLTMSARDDYVRDTPSDEYCWFLNQHWNTLIPIVFIDGRCPTVLACKDHENGLKLLMINPCRSKNSL